MHYCWPPRFESGGIVHPGTFHIALAVAAGADLFLPVIRDVERKPLSRLRQEIESVAARARSGTLRVEDSAGASIALTNLGMYPVEWFDAIVFPGHTAILALGAIEDRPVVRGGNVEVRRMATVILAADHRLINGRVAAEYLTKLKELIESTTVWES
ncbi:MAG: 2-oxo acid dehydrogenase subunit E2 [Acidobacteria bacterium]|nr:2-oxo acid dehydrogenase subunit E2 [Acidobacteriota bacterium]